jgi:D-alanine-D-alanine ligase
VKGVAGKKPRKVVVLMGGRSPEREISLKTGRRISSALAEVGYNVLEVDPKGDFIKGLNDFRPDVVFIALHGRYGEDGTIQGLLEVLGYPYTGSGVLASALCMDKVMAKKVLLYEGISTPPFRIITAGECQERQRTETADRLIEELGLPLVVKPSRQGSTIGVSVVRKAEELEKAITDAFRYDQTVFAEKFIDGVEVTASIIGTKNPRVLPLLEIVPATGFYDYTAKYSPGMSQHIIPARIPQDVAERVEELALRSYRALGCRQFARVDFMIDREDTPFVLEVNTIPGMTETSLLPDSAKAAGITFAELVSLFVEEAWALAHDECS